MRAATPMRVWIEPVKWAEEDGESGLPLAAAFVECPWCGGDAKIAGAPIHTVKKVRCGMFSCGCGKVGYWFEARKAVYTEARGPSSLDVPCEVLLVDGTDIQ